MNKEASKEIVVLSEKDHIRNRPQMYVGSVKPTEEKVPVIKNSKIFIEEKLVSIGMYKILNEAIDNAVDEAKRMKGKMKCIIVRVSPKTNAISVKDTGNGFFNGASINKATGKTNIETAFSQLRSGSNFSNDDIDESLIGTNGYGIKTLNVLSERFKVITVNDTHYFENEWIDFESDGSKKILRKKKASDEKGTYIEAEPLKEVFGDSKWDLDILKASLVFKQRLIQKDPILKSLKLQFFWEDEEISLSDEFFPKESFSLETPIGEIVIWEKYEGSGSVSFINSAMCTGIHQKIINEYINAKLEDTLGHHFYDTFVSLNLPPKIVKFGDQNKTRFVSPREEVYRYIDMEIGKRIVSFFRTDLFLSIQKKVDERRYDAEYKKLKARKKNVNIKHSHKYFPPTTKKAESLYIVEGLSACGSILQKRNPQKEGVYALKGKIKNARSLNDLSTNREILELMQILNLDPDSPQLQCPFENIVIATDGDPDGFHIRSLLINLFYNWFPWLVEQGRVHLLETPLISIGDRSRKYFYSMEDFKNFSGQKTHVRYLKGLGSLALSDWEYVMENKLLVQIRKDVKSTQNLEMAFGKLSSLRKDWLSAE
jgi:DNA gyrase/topoisomerase IV subunit B